MKITCDFCTKPAIYDGKTFMGPWANMCELHFTKYGIPIKGFFSLLESEKTRVCRICSEEKPLSDYYAYIDNRGTKRYRTECKECNLMERKIRSFRKDR